MKKQQITIEKKVIADLGTYIILSGRYVYTQKKFMSNKRIKSQSGFNIYINPGEFKALLNNNFTHAFADGYYTVKLYGNKLFVYMDNEFTGRPRTVFMTNKAGRLFDVCNKLTSGQTITIVPDNLRTNQPEPIDYSWSNLLFKNIGLSKSAKQTIIRVKNNIPNHLNDVKQFLTRYYNTAAIFADDNKYSFYFDGRNNYPGINKPCGHNGGYIAHETSKGIEYSVHT